jgi:orotate phosphoribosyltransferase
MIEAEQKLLQLLKDRSFKLGSFRLASGDQSNYFIDGKMTQVFSEAAYLIGEVLYEHTKDLAFDAIGGLEVGAVPLTTAAVISYHLHGRSLEGFWVRDKAKDHGTKKTVEGNLKPGSRVVVVDDVITRGQSGAKAVHAVRELGCEVVLVVALVDRLQGARQLYTELGITNFRSVFTIRDFGIDVDAPPPKAATR